MSPRSGAAAVRVPDRGSVLLELALAIPALLAVTCMLAWVISLGVAHARAGDAARDVARALARGEDRASAESVLHRVLPDAELEIRETREVLVVSVTIESTTSVPLLDRMSVVVRGEAATTREQGIDAHGW